MKNQNKEIIIIGAGLTGLTLAYFLKKAGISSLILEASDRIGGRIHTVKDEQDTPFELGATWFGYQHQHLIQLLKTLGLSSFPQEQGNYAIYEQFSTSPPQLVQLPQGGESSNRIAGGTGKIIEQLMMGITPDSVLTEHIVTAINQQEDFIEIVTSKGIYKAAKVVSTLPPNLFVNRIKCTPSLPESLIKIAHATHTWMGESIKVGFTYATPFWKKKGTSGTIFSNTGPITEMYDHSNIEGNKYALKGFMNGSYYSLSKEERKTLALNQLKKYYGAASEAYITYQEMSWRTEAFAFHPYNGPIIPHQNNGHNEYRKTYLDDRLFIGGTETAIGHPGYLDGAIQSALEISKKLINKYGSHF